MTTTTEKLRAACEELSARDAEVRALNEALAFALNALRAAGAGEATLEAIRAMARGGAR